MESSDGRELTYARQVIAGVLCCSTLLCVCSLFVLTGGAAARSDAVAGPAAARSGAAATRLAAVADPAAVTRPAAAADPAAATRPQAATHATRSARYFTNVAFVSSSRLFGVGNGIYRSSNGGRVWTKQQSANARLQGIDFAGTRHGWVVGSHGVVFSTSNGGASWIRRSVPTKRDLVSVDFVDRLHGWIVGSPAIVLSTRDGGRSWHTQLSSPASAYRQPQVVRFFSRSVGLIGGFCYSSASWRMYRTTDGGRHWRSPAMGATGGFSDIDLAGKYACAVGYVPYEIGSYPPVCYSSDSGKTWQARSFPWPCALWQVELVNAATVFAVGAEEGDTAISLFRSADAGVTWDRVTLPVGSLPGLAALHFTSATTGVLIAANGAAYRTVDRGATWQRL